MVCLWLSVVHQSELQSDAEVNRNYIAANTDAHLGNPSHLTDQSECGVVPSSMSDGRSCRAMTLALFNFVTDLSTCTIERLVAGYRNRRAHSFLQSPSLSAHPCANFNILLKRLVSAMS